MTDELRRSAGLGAVAVLWGTLGAAALLSGFPLLGERPLSWMVADRATSVPFRGALLAAALLLAVFCLHVRGRYPVGRGFTFAMLGGMAMQAVAALVPIDGGPTANRVHTVAALALGVSLPVLMWRFAVAQPPGPWRRVALSLFWVEVAACTAGVLLSKAGVAPLAEIVPAAGFHLWIVVLTLFGPERRRAVGRSPAPGDSYPRQHPGVAA